MLFERENAKSFERPSEARLRLELGRLRGYGKTSFASLTAEDGSYVQVAGGGVACTVEWQPVDGRLLRGYHDIPKVPFPDGTPLCYSGGWVQMLRDEWFFVEQVADVFVAFRSRESSLPLCVGGTTPTAFGPMGLVCSLTPGTGRAGAT